jgi:membrane-associated phospholipid phosphatase
MDSRNLRARRVSPILPPTLPEPLHSTRCRQSAFDAQSLPMRRAAGSTLQLSGRFPVWLPVLLFALVAVATIGLAALDVPIAATIARTRVLDAFVDFLELITLKNVSEFIVPMLLLVCGGALWALGQPRQARAAIYVGLVPLIAYLASDLSKPLFGRLRPFETVQRHLADTWFAGGNSFPSGHVAFFAGLAVPVVLLFPRAWPLLFVPILVAAQRLLAADHYLSDVTASFALAVLVAIVLGPMLPGQPNTPQGGRN